MPNEYPAYSPEFCLLKAKEAEKLAEHATAVPLKRKYLQKAAQWRALARRRHGQPDLPDDPASQ